VRGLERFGDLSPYGAIVLPVGCGEPGGAASFSGGAKPLPLGLPLFGDGTMVPDAVDEIVPLTGGPM
jgi:hypothetical protein